MIVAEFCDLIYKHETTIKGALAYNLGTYYNEFQVINHMGEDIHVIDHQNRIVIIKPQEGASIREDDRCITIQYRHVNGPRKIGSMAMELNDSVHHRMTIPRSVLMGNSVFVEEVNALFFCPKWHVNTNLHPHSKEYIQQEHDRLRKAIGYGAQYSPITIMANDPTGEIKALHVVINGKIHSIKVTNYNSDASEVDVVAIGIRGATNGELDDLNVIQTTFEKLTKQNPLFWNIEGFLISSDRTWLENKLEVDKIKPTPNVVPVEEVKSLIAQAREVDGAIIKDLNETIVQKNHELKELKNRYNNLKDSYDDLVKGNYLDRSSTVAYRKIDLEEAKLQTTVEEAKLNQKTERLKLTKEQISTIATVMKTIAVIVPLIVLYIKYKQSKSA